MRPWSNCARLLFVADGIKLMTAKIRILIIIIISKTILLSIFFIKYFTLPFSIRLSYFKYCHFSNHMINRMIDITIVRQCHKLKVLINPEKTRLIKIWFLNLIDLTHIWSFQSVKTVYRKGLNLIDLTHIWSHHWPDRNITLGLNLIDLTHIWSQ